MRVVDLIFHALDVLMEAQIEGGVEGIIVGGAQRRGTSHVLALYVMLIAHCSKHFGDRIKIVGNVGSNNTGEAVYASQQGFAVGMDAALHINPYYGKTSEQGVIRHLEEAMEHGPTFLYNVPGRTGQDIEPHVVEKFADHPHLVGVKECMRDSIVSRITPRRIFCVGAVTMTTVSIRDTMRRSGCDICDGKYRTRCDVEIDAWSY